MINLSPQEKIDIYKHLFRSREDVFAMYWKNLEREK